MKKMKSMDKDIDMLPHITLFIMIGSLIGSVALFMIDEKYKLLSIAISIIILITFLYMKEKVKDDKFPYIKPDRTSKYPNLVDTVVSVIYTVINNYVMILAIFAVYIASVSSFIGRDNLKEKPVLEGRYIIQQKDENRNMILFDDKFTYHVVLVSEDSNYYVGNTIDTKLNDVKKFKITKVERK